jgi:hypothetical protein
MAERLHNTLIETNEQEQSKERDVLSKF